MKKSVLKKYAHLVAKMGLNVQKGQDVWITCDLDQPEFVQMVAEECYKCGARDVLINWNYQPMEKVSVKYKSLEDLSTFKEWQLAKLQYQADTVPCRLFIMSEDPDGLKGMDNEKLSKAQQSRYPVIKHYRDMWEDKDQWCIVAVPSVKWAKKLFPNLRKNQAVEKLWDAILFTTRIDEDPVKTWQAHNKDMHERCNFLNSLGIESLHYQASNGTDFTVGMIGKGRFAAASEISLQGIEFNPNMPSEECFISPMKGKAEGIVYATKPLSYQGQLIENFWIKFKNGKAVEWQAEKNNELLTKMINMDENACYLGECALVPFDSPINKSGILFYNTLFDENACCHLALGMGFPSCIEDHEKIGIDECRKLGVNDSMIHEDFMIGTADLNITAKCRNGKTVEIFRNGTWAFN